jgi:hypothetical protein
MPSQEEQADKFIAKLTGDEEFFGLIGTGHPNSFYTVYVRTDPKGKWWKFEVEAAVGTVDPVANQKKLHRKEQSTAVAVWGHVRQLVDFKCDEKRPALVKLLAHAKKLTAS